jgi:class 3 adenylate cyclase
MEPRVQYARSKDGVNIAFWAMGEGEPLVIMPSMPVSHIEYEWQVPSWRNWYERLGQRRRLIRYDGRGMGLSDRKSIDYSLETMHLDLEAVVDRLGLETFALLAAYHPGPIAIDYAARHPERVSHLLLWCTFAKAGELVSPTIYATRSLIEQDWEVYTQTAAHVLVGWQAGQAAQEFARYIREANTPEGMLAMLRATSEFDASVSLSQVKAPTLVMHRTGISWLNPEAAHGLAAAIPGARLLLLEGDSIAPYLGNVDEVTRTMFEFLGEESEERPSHTSTLRTILFTDIEGHTTMMHRLGDEKGRAVLREHERITRAALRAHGGSEIKTMGDGFMASFVSAQRALQCSVELQRAFAAYNDGSDEPLRVRVGLNAGEPIEEQHDLFGTAVIVASRCAAQAKGGEILATDVVRQLAGGRGFDFADRGPVVLRGFDDAVRLYEVKWEVN